MLGFTQQGMLDAAKICNSNASVSEAAAMYAYNETLQCIG
jgi:hypothetical protein